MKLICTSTSYSLMVRKCSYFGTLFVFATRVLEDACRDDAELRAVLGDSIGNPELMRKRVIWIFVMTRLLG